MVKKLISILFMINLFSMAFDIMSHADTSKAFSA